MSNTTEHATSWSIEVMQDGARIHEAFLGKTDAAEALRVAMSWATLKGAEVTIHEGSYYDKGYRAFKLATV